MPTENSYLSDIEEILLHRHDNGGDYWATPDKRLLKGAPFTTIESPLYLLELGVSADDPIMKETANLIFSTWKEDGRFKIFPTGSIYPCQTAESARTLCYMGYANDSRIETTFQVGQQDGRISSMKIHKASLADWGMDEDEAYENALANTYFLTPPRIYKWECLLFNPDYEGDDFMDMNYEENIVERNAGSCLSTSIRTNGAVAVFLPDVAQRIADLMDDDFYIVFTSVHEAMIHSKRMFCPEDLERILKETLKEATLDEDFLTDEIYYYDRGARKIMKWKKVVSKVTLPASCVERLPL